MLNLPVIDAHTQLRIPIIKPNEVDASSSSYVKEWKDEGVWYKNIEGSILLVKALATSIKFSITSI